MRKFFQTAIIAGALTGAALSPATTQAADASVDVAYFSSYVWRGQIINNEPVLQPAFSASTPFGLSFTAWGNMDTTDKFDNRGEFTEVDLTVAYDLPLEGPIGVSVGASEYLFPKEGNYTPEVPEGHTEVEAGKDTDTREVYVSVSADILLSPTISLYYDVDEIKGFYASLGISHGFALMEKLSLDLGASIGAANHKYNEGYFGEDKHALNDLNLSASLAYALTETLSFSGAVYYTTLLDADIKDGAEAAFGDKDRFYANLAASYAF